MRLGDFTFTILLYSYSIAHCYANDSTREGTILNKLGKNAYCFKDVEFQGQKYICEQVVLPDQICKGDALGFYVKDNLTVYKIPNAYVPSETPSRAQFECEEVSDSVFCYPNSAMVEATAVLGDLYGKTKNYFSWDQQSPIQDSTGTVENFYGYMSISYFLDLMGGAKDTNRILASCRNDKPVGASLIVRDLFKQLEEQGLTCNEGHQPAVSPFIEQARHGRATLDVIIKLYALKNTQ